MPGGNAREAALGLVPSDLIISGCSLVSVYTGEVIPDTQIAVSGYRIAYVGPDASHAAGPDTKTLDVKGRHVAPGLADPHTHLDQFVLPYRAAALMLERGTTSLFSDPIDVTGVGGYGGFRWFAAACRAAPTRIFHAVPGGQPVDPGLSHLRGLTEGEIGELLRDPDVFGMGEVFSWTKVTRGDPRTLRDIKTVLDAGGIVNGHTAGMSGYKLAAYAAAGISSCHEPIDYDQTVERLRAGLYVMVREGSVRRDLRGIMEEVASRGVSTHRMMFCSDGLNPTDLHAGHMDACVRKAISAGIDPVDAVAMATRNVFEYYGMDGDLGGLAPGRLADIVILDDLESFRVNTVLVGGAEAAGRRAPPTPRWVLRTVRLGSITAADFAVKAAGSGATANTIRLRTEIITEPGEADLPVRDGLAVPSGAIWKAAAFDRVHQTGSRAVGFLEGFGEGDGALATTASLHENDLVIVGRDDADMAAAANHLVEAQGGMAVARKGRIVASMPLPAAGLMSEGDPDTVREQFEAVNGAARDMGCRFAHPHMVPVFLPFLALPHIRILNRGIVNVRTREVVPPIREATPSG